MAREQNGSTKEEEVNERNRRDAGIYEAGPGRFRVVVNSGKRLPSGRYEQVVRIVSGTKTDARNLRDQLRADVTRGDYVPPARELLGVYLMSWLERIHPPHGKIKVSTWKSYESHVRVHLLPDPIADRRVSDLTTTDVEDLFRRLLDKGLSPASVDAVRRTLRRALNAHRKLATNPVRGADSPRVPRHEIDEDLLWTHDQARRFLRYAGERDADMTALVRLALDSGARLGELLAITWGDIDLARQTVRLRRSVSAKRLPGDDRMLRFDSPKNDKARTLDLDAGTVGALRQLRERQVAEGVADVGQLIFRRPTRLGFQPWRPDVTTHVFQRLAGEANVPVIPFHYLRHACASWLLGAGMDVVAVSERLGHWSPSLTLSVYAHAIRGRQRELAQAIGAALNQGTVLT
jgi:integrase